MKYQTFKIQRESIIKILHTDKRNKLKRNKQLRTFIYQILVSKHVNQVGTEKKNWEKAKPCILKWGNTFFDKYPRNSHEVHTQTIQH